MPTRSCEWPYSGNLVRGDNDLNAVSIFELSPSEKLQLVEDLWDDLAATPSEVPVGYRELRGHVKPSHAFIYHQLK